MEPCRYYYLGCCRHCWRHSTMFIFFSSRAGACQRLLPHHWLSTSMVHQELQHLIMSSSSLNSLWWAIIQLRLHTCFTLSILYPRHHSFTYFVIGCVDDFRRHETRELPFFCTSVDLEPSMRNVLNNLRNTVVVLPFSLAYMTISVHS